VLLLAGTIRNAGDLVIHFQKVAVVSL